MPSFDRVSQPTPVDEYLPALKHQRAEEGFAADFGAMQKATTFVLVLPCGRSAHAEIGWAAGAGKRTAVLLDGPLVIPELMYKMFDHIATDVMGLVEWVIERTTA